jgi:hypothetical protein
LITALNAGEQNCGIKTIPNPAGRRAIAVYGSPFICAAWATLKKKSTDEKPGISL